MSRMESDEKSFWVWLTIFGLLFGTAPFIYWQGYHLSGIVCGIVGLAGLLMFIREQLVGPTKTLLRVLAVVIILILIGQMIGYDIINRQATARLSAVRALVLLACVCMAVLVSAFASRMRKPQPQLPPKTQSKLVILSALYGIGDGMDVVLTDKLNAITKDGLVVPVNNNLVDHDPAPNKPKRLKVKYQYDAGQPRTIAVPEHGWLMIPEDAQILNLENQLESLKANTARPWREGFVRPRFELVDNRKFENEEITVDGKSFRRCSFKNVKLLFHGTAPFEFVEETTVDSGTVMFTTDDPAIMAFDTMQTKFASIPGAQVQRGALDEKGKDVPFTPLTVESVKKPGESQALPHFVYVNIVSLSVDERRITGGKTLKIRYLIDCTEDVSGKLWLGASLPDKQGKYIFNVHQDKPISLIKGRHEYDRDLTIPANTPPGSYKLQGNVWHGVLGDSAQSTRLANGGPIEIEVVA